MINFKLKVKAPAKINLHLEVIGKRKDGFHELSMVMQSIDLADYLEIESNDKKKIELFSDCKELCNTEDNLITKAASILRNYSKNKNLGATILLKKNIPIGAGLAGGSSDAAATLIGLNKLWNLDFSYEIIYDLACSLGSDVPFCLKGGSQFSFGRGEILEKYEYNNEYAVILIKDPNVYISTKEVYGQFSDLYVKPIDYSANKLNERRSVLKALGINNDTIFQKKINIRNDLQKVVERDNKSVDMAITLLSQLKNSLGISMSGSGPSCYAIFKDIHLANKAYEENKELFNKYNFEVWTCKFLNKGVSIIP